MEACIICIHFDPDTDFCRRNPPSPVLENGKYIKTIFPKIPYPEKDYCSEFINKDDLE